MHEHALRLVYNNNSTSFGELLERDKSATIHERKKWEEKIFKLKSRVTSEIMIEIF